MYRENYYKRKECQTMAENNGQDLVQTPSQTTPPSVESGVEKTIDKALYDKLASDFSALKKQYNAKLSDEEKFKLDEEARLQEVEALKRENQEFRLKTALSKGGYDDEFVEKATKLITNGKMTEFIGELNTYIQNVKLSTEKSVKETLLKSNPQPAPQESNTTKTLKDYMSAEGMAELNRLQKENPQEYQRILKS